MDTVFVHAAPSYDKAALHIRTVLQRGKQEMKGSYAVYPEVPMTDRFFIE